MISNRSRLSKRAAGSRKPLPGKIARVASPVELFGQVLAMMGLDSGNDRALANAEGVLGALHRAREEVDALELRIARVAPAGLRVGWPVSPPDGPVPAPREGQFPMIVSRVRPPSP
jgi:hypothetical protein